MKSNPSLSVCMATYNGSEYLRPQIESILSQIGLDDEVVIVDDRSRDNSVDYIRSLNDNRIKVFVNEQNVGPNKSFERALSLARNDVIFMADQDDVWVPGRVRAMLAALEASDAYVVSGGSRYIDRSGSPISVQDIPEIEPNTSKDYLGNILKIFRGNIGYFGCAMAIRKEFLDVVVPFPEYTQSHDLWIAMAANVAGRNIHVDDAVLYRRIHGSNYSYVKRSILQKLYSRLVFCRSLGVLLGRVYAGSSLKRG